MTIQHVLVPVDFSPYAEHALEYAVALAKTLHARLTLLHVIEPLPLSRDATIAFPHAYLQELESTAQHQLEQVLARAQEAGLHATTAIVHGVPFQGIVDAAREQQADLIVMGTHGRTGLRHVLVGSVAEKVVRLAPCPVLVTRGTSEAPEA
jgi:nucleotide-binding universal stress UspA family protein